MPERRPVAKAQLPVLIPWLQREGISTLPEGRKKLGHLSVEAEVHLEAWLVLGSGRTCPSTTSSQTAGYWKKNKILEAKKEGSLKKKDGIMVPTTSCSQLPVPTPLDLHPLCRKKEGVPAV